MYASQARAFIITHGHPALGCLRQQQRAALARTLTASRVQRDYHSQTKTTRGVHQKQGVSTSAERRGRTVNASIWTPGSLRSLHSTPVTLHSGIDRPAPGTGLKVHFKDSNDKLIRTVEANDGDNILEIAHEYDIDLEGACEGSVACSTCHIILPESYYDLLPEPEDDENDMLDMAFGLTDTSRLGCQVIMKKELDGIECKLPAATRNMFVDGKKSSH